MEEKRTAYEKSVRQSQRLCAGEHEYVLKRKRVVLQSLNSLGISSSEDSVPHIALLSSGGGQRAAVALVGSLHQMEKDGLLDSVLYLGGVSGSTWSMASLYSDPQWSMGMDRAVSSLTSPGVELDEALSWLGERAKEEGFSLTDIWGVLTSAGIMKQMDLRLLSGEAGRKATNPYPIYCAIEKYFFSEGPLEATWFEMSPHEAGFTDLGLFIETSLLGSKFENGELQEEIAEMDMVKLQGVFGSALAHEDMIKEFIPHWLNVPGQEDDAAEEYVRLYYALHRVVGLTRNLIPDPAAQADLDKLHKLLEDADEAHRVEYESESLQDKESVSQQRTEQLLAVVERWSQTLEDGAFKNHVMFIISPVLPLIVKWEWGTTNNFLYQYQNCSVPPYLQTEENFNLVDAGLLVNVAFPSFLGDKRDIDLIIAPEFSAGNMFENLTLARDYAAKLKKPFPEIDEKILEERDWPKDCYVFEGKEKEPTIVFMLLFNRNNYAEEVKAKMAEFTTFQHSYSQEKVEFLLETATENMKRNKQTLLREIKKAAGRRRCRKSARERFSESCLFGLV